MLPFKIILIVSTFISNVPAFIENAINGISAATLNQFVNPTESYIGPSSYATSFQSNNHDYPSIGNYGYLMNLKHPQITAAYTSFGPSEGNDFSSTSYTNYPSSTVVEVIPESVRNGSSESSYTANISNDSQMQLPPNLSALFSSSSNQEVPISQHIEVTKPIVVPVFKKFPYPVSKDFPVAIPHPVLVPVPAPYPVNVLVSEPVAVPILKEIKVPVEREVMYPVEKNVPVEVEKPVQFYLEKHYPVYVNKPYPVKIPIIKTVIHKVPKKWSREEKEEMEVIKRYEKSPNKMTHTKAMRTEIPFKRIEKLKWPKSKIFYKKQK